MVYYKVARYGETVWYGQYGPVLGKNGLGSKQHVGKLCIFKGIARFKFCCLQALYCNLDLGSTCQNTAKVHAHK